MKVAVITISDRASKGIYEDLSGPEIEVLLTESFGEEITVMKKIIPDDAKAIQKVLDEFGTGENPADFILTTGGTGIGPRDLTPDITAAWCEKELPGIAEILRAESYRETPSAMLSRGYAGIKETTIVVNFPGSVKAVRLCTRLMIPVIAHAGPMIRGEGH